MLVVEDDELTRRTLEDFLGRCGYEVHGCADGRSAWRWLECHRADLVITDIFMPEMDGVEVIRKLQRERPATKVIAISGDVIDWPARFGVARLLGAHGTLPKPFLLGDLLRLVRLQLA